MSVHQIVRTREGSMVSEGDVLHVYELRNGLVSRMDVEEPTAAP